MLKKMQQSDVNMIDPSGNTDYVHKKHKPLGSTRVVLPEEPELQKMIPVIDFCNCLEDVDLFMKEHLENIGDEIARSFSEVGFAYLARTGFNRYK